MGSNFPVVEKEHLNARVIRRKKSAILPGRLPLRACKRLFDRRKVVEMQRSDPMNIGGSYRRCGVHPHRVSLNTAQPTIESKLASSMIFGK
jgi:hypothetical protein